MLLRRPAGGDRRCPFAPRPWLPDRPGQPAGGCKSPRTSASVVGCSTARPEARVPGHPSPVVAAMARSATPVSFLATVRAWRLTGRSRRTGDLPGGMLARAGCERSPSAPSWWRRADPFGASAAGEPPLVLAVRLGWPRLLERLLRLGVDLDACDGRGMTALHHAAALGREEALKPLAAGAACDRRGGGRADPRPRALAAGRRDRRVAGLARLAPARCALQATDAGARSSAMPRRLRSPAGPAAGERGGQPGCSAPRAGGGHRALVELLLARGADPGVCREHWRHPAVGGGQHAPAGDRERLLDAGGTGTARRRATSPC